MNRIWSYAGIIALLGLLLALTSLSSASIAVAIICTLAAMPVVDSSQDDSFSRTRSHVRRIRAFSEALAKVGPHSQFEDVTRLVVNATSTAMSTDHTAIFTIDSFTGAIECDSTPSVTQEAKNAFLELYGNTISDPTRRDAWVLQCTQDQHAGTSDALQILTRNGIRHIVAAPIRSETNASGALVSFYTEQFCFELEFAGVMEAIAAQVSTSISFILALEQSRFLLDDLAGANQELSVQATVDGLTGLANHRTLQQTLCDLCSSSKNSHKQIFSLVMIDVDHFKLYNDSHGHQEGDGVLRRVAKVLSSSLRQGDLAARYGGEEFALVLKGISRDNAVCVAERIRRSIADQSYRKGSVTISMGIAQFPEDGTEPGEVIERADRALYHAKITGRNRVITWGCQDNPHESGVCPTEAATQKTVLILECPDESHVGRIAESLSAGPYSVMIASTLKDAIEMLRTTAYDIAFVSQRSLPNTDMKHLNRIIAIHPDMPVILISDNLPVGSGRDALRSGASDILQKPYNPSEVPMLVERNLERRRLERQRMMQKSTGLLLQAIEALVAAIDAKDHLSMAE